MIFKGNKEIISIYKGEKAIVEIRKGLSLVWELLMSCFGKGYWINERPWMNNAAWKSAIETGGEDVKPYLYIDKKKVNIPTDGSSQTIKVRSNTNWRIV